MSKVVTKFNSKYYDDVLSLGGTLIRHGFSLEVTPDDIQEVMDRIVEIDKKLKLS